MKIRFGIVLVAAMILSALAINGGEFEKMVNTTLKHNVPEIHAREAINLRDYILLDTREKAEFDISHLKSARWVGYNDFQIARVSDIPKNTPILLYCSIGYRSERIASRLQEAGYTNVINLVGGIFAWSNLDKPVYNEKGQTFAVHPYNAFWGLWLKKRKNTITSDFPVSRHPAGKP